MFENVAVRDVHIRADKQTVWSVLRDLPGYRDWCSRTFFYSMPRLGKFQIMRVKVHGEWSSMPVRIKVLSEEQGLCWRGGIPFGFIGDHSFQVTSNRDGSSTVTQRESVGGLLMPFMWPAFGKDLLCLYDDINADLKRHIESR